VFGIVGISQKLWEPALLAMAVGQVMMMLAGLALSLAGLAPTGVWGVFGISWYSMKLVGAGLPAMAVGQSTLMLADLALSRAGSLLQFLVSFRTRSWP
jgi:hypothetical protein